MHGGELIWSYVICPVMYSLLVLCQAQLERNATPGWRVSVSGG